ncbi:MAG: HlyD family secretion protein [Gammaproteobacteria bacterium]|nr:HlyD family secretion protein [Gammaproteobacteria bacterium]
MILKFNRKKLVILGLIIAGVLLGSTYYFYENYYYPSTDDAYVNANIPYIAPQVNGQVMTVNVLNHQAVTKGTTLFTIDPTPFQDALDQAQGQYRVAQAQYQADQEAIKVAAANLASTEAEFVLNQKNTQRMLALVKEGYASTQDGDQAIANLKSAQANLDADIANLSETKENLLTQASQIKVAEANFNTAKLNLSYTTVTAPVDGIVSDLTLRPGMIVSAGSNLFAMVNSTSEYWVDANYKETQLERIKPGQSANIELDLYPGVVFKGVIQSISAADGTTFSLLPAENATGNWVKITQRFIVKVIIPHSSLQDQYPLRVGASAEVTVNTHS